MTHLERLGPDGLLARLVLGVLLPGKLHANLLVGVEEAVRDVDVVLE